MLKRWLWWQIEASLEYLEDESSISLSDLTIHFWMAMVLLSVHASGGPPLQHGWQIKEMCELA